MRPENSWSVYLDEEKRLYWEGEAGSVHHHEPGTGWWRRFKAGFIGLFPLEKYFELHPIKIKLSVDMLTREYFIKVQGVHWIPSDLIGLCRINLH